METNSENYDFIGTAVYGSSQGIRKVSKNYKVIADKDNIFRILPPYGLLAKLGRWSYFESAHWGYATSTGLKRSFRCIFRKNRKSGMTEQDCPECTKITEITTLRENKRKELVKRGVSEDDISEALSEHSKWLFDHNLNRSHKLNAMTPSGEIGRLFLKIKHKQVLDTFIDNLMTGKVVKGRNIDPISTTEGVFINFTKSGIRSQTQFYCTPVYDTKEVEGDVVQIIKKAPLTSDVLARMKTEAYELSLGPTDLTYDQIDRLVKSGGDPKIVDQVFGSPVTSEGSAALPERDYEESPTEATVDAETALMGHITKTKKEPDRADFEKMFKLG